MRTTVEIKGNQALDTDLALNNQENKALQEEPKGIAALGQMGGALSNGPYPDNRILEPVSSLNDGGE